MFPHEEYLAKALNESSSIHQLITDLVSLWVNRVNAGGTDEDFVRAMHFEKSLNNFLMDWYTRRGHPKTPVVPPES